MPQAELGASVPVCLCGRWRLRWVLRFGVSHLGAMSGAGVYERASWHARATRSAGLAATPYRLSSAVLAGPAQTNVELVRRLYALGTPDAVEAVTEQLAAPDVVLYDFRPGYRHLPRRGPGC